MEKTKLELIIDAENRIRRIKGICEDYKSGNKPDGDIGSVLLEVIDALNSGELDEIIGAIQIVKTLTELGAITRTNNNVNTHEHITSMNDAHRKYMYNNLPQYLIDARNNCTHLFDGEDAFEVVDSEDPKVTYRLCKVCGLAADNLGKEGNFREYTMRRHFAE